MRNTDALVAYQYERYVSLDRRLRAAVLDLLDRQQPVSVRAVARLAEVDRKSVYRHREVVALIKSCREQ